MSKINITLADLENESVLDELESETSYISSRVIKSESLSLRDKEKTYGNKSKSIHSRREDKRGF